MTDSSISPPNEDFPICYQTRSIQADSTDASKSQSIQHHHQQQQLSLNHAPYLFQKNNHEDHENLPPVKYRAYCHCQRVSYALRRERPLDAKYCHCRGCQIMHGMI